MCSSNEFENLYVETVQLVHFHDKSFTELILPKSMPSKPSAVQNDKT